MFNAARRPRVPKGPLVQLRPLRRSFDRSAHPGPPAPPHHSFHRIFIVAALAESNEGGVGIFELRLAAFDPEIPPFLLKVIDIIARRDDPGIIVGVKIKRRKQRRFGGRQRLHGFAVRESDVVSVKPDRVVRHMVMLRVFIANLADQAAKFLVA
jgi:hypothetical protein